MIQRWQIKNWAVAHPWTVGIALVLLIAFAIGGGSWWTARRYDKGRLKYEVDSKAWATERAGLIANAEAKEKQVAELELQVTAFRAAAEQGKKVDDTLADKIDQVSKEAADEALVTDADTDCWIRGDRTCAKLRSLKPPIVIDCDAYKRKLCSR